MIRKILIFVVFLLVLALGSELFLRTTFKPKPLEKKDTYKILILGEEDPNQGNEPWSVQLETKLREKAPGIKFEIANKAVLGNHTTAILAQLEDNLNRYTPDIVITNMGINDSSAPHLFVKYQQAMERAVSTRLPFSFEELRIFKLLRPLLSSTLNPVYAQPEMNSQYYVGQGRQFEQTGRYEEAIGAFEKALELNPQNDEAYMGLAQVYRRQSMHDKALELYQKALELNPENDTAYEGIASAYRGLGMFEKSVETYEKARAMNPQNYMYYLVPGHMYRERGIYDRAEEIYKAGIDANPEDDHTRVWLARVYRDTERFDEAEEILKTIIEKREEYEKGLEKADKLKEQKQYEEAEKTYQEIISASPNNYMAHVRLGFLYGELGKADEAIRALNNAINTNHIADYPSLPYTELEFLYRQMGKSQEARKVHEKVLENSPALYNYRKLNQILRERGIRLVAVQYPMRDIETLRQTLNYDDYVVYVDNQATLQEAKGSESYYEYFVDRTFGDFGYATAQANSLIAENIANTMLTQLGMK